MLEMCAAFISNSGFMNKKNTRKLYGSGVIHYKQYTARYERLLCCQKRRNRK